MCNSIVMPGGVQLSNVAEIRAAGLPIPDGAVDDWPDGACLCGVDVEAILEAAGLPWLNEFGAYDVGPRRIRRRRVKGWRAPACTVMVTRPGPFGNPFPWKGSWITWTAVALGYRADEAGRKACAVALHRGWLTGEPVVLGPFAGDRVGGSFVYSDGSAAGVGEVARGLAGFAAATADDRPATLPDRPDLAPLRGKHLGCYCAEGDPCHGDTLLELANKPLA